MRNGNDARLSQKVAMKRKLLPPTDAEDQAITAAALSDLDAQPLTDSDFGSLQRRPGERVMQKIAGRKR